MAHSLSREENIGHREFTIEAIDDEIAALLIAIEEERAPAQLQELALKLQTALANKKAGKAAD